MAVNLENGRLKRTKEKGTRIVAAWRERHGRPHPNAMTLLEHLSELRRRLIISVVAFVAASIVAAVFYQQMLNLLQHPYCRVNPGHCSFYYTAPLDPLTLRIKLAAFGGLVLSLPVALWELWRFINPGLHRHERRVIVPFVVAGSVLFVGGCALAYLVFPHALEFLQSVGGPSLREILNPNQYLSLVIIMMVLFGSTFELPVILVALQLAHIVTPRTLLDWWRWAVISLTLIAAIFTPSSDPFSMLALAVPLVAFYFLAILIGKLLL